MTAHDPSSRMSLAQVRSHPYLQVPIDEDAAKKELVVSFRKCESAGNDSAKAKDPTLEIDSDQE